MNKLIKDEPQHRVVVHQINLKYMDDPELYVASPLWEWETSEQGKWVMQHSIETPEWYSVTDTNSYGHVYRIVATLYESDLVYWRLRWG